MAIIKVTYLLRSYIGGNSQIRVDGTTVAEVMQSMVIAYPSFRPHLYKSDGTLRAHINLFIRGEHIRDLQGLDTEVVSDDVIDLVPSIAGG